MKILVLAAALAGFVSASSEMRCQECITEMHKLDAIVKAGAAEIEEYLKASYCPSLGEDHIQQCEENLAGSYNDMLYMIVNHFFVDGAQHICMAMGVCHPYKDVLINKEPRPFTCEECVEGMSWVEAYMKDPLWVAEYTLYLEQNYCVGEKPNCIDLVYTHFPPMHSMAMEQFWIPEDICAEWCSGDKPTKPPMKEE